MPPKSESAAIWNPFTAKSRAEQSAQEMYPGKIGQDDQRDAARHMLASGYLSKAWGPGIADLIGRAYEFKETPLRHLGALAGLNGYRYDRPIDLHNNATGIELAQKAQDMEEFERLVNAAAERARPTPTPGVPWVPTPKDAAAMRKTSQQYADGGEVTLDHTQPDMADGGRMIADPNLYAKGGLVKSALKTVFDKAHELAQRNAALPVEKGGLGLRPDNTAAERAAAMGYTREVYHSALKDTDKFNPSGQYAGHKGVSGVSTADNPELASRYLDRYGDVDYKGEPFAKNVMPLLARVGNELATEVSPFKSPVPMGFPLPKGYSNPMIKSGIDTMTIPDSISRKGPVKHSEAKNAIRGNEVILSNPANLRSRFAAFDPFEQSSPDLLKAEGGLVAAFKDGGDTSAAFGHFPQMRPHRAGKSEIGEDIAKFFIPQDMLDVALMAAPYGKLGKLAAAGVAALSPMDAEAGKLKTGVDLARRSLFGLRPTQEMAGRELVRKAEPTLDEMRAALDRAERAAPKVEERSVTIDPGRGSTKVTDVVQKVAETPVSRRTVLKSASSQALRHAMPAHSFADLMKPAEVAKQAAEVVAPTLSIDALPALVGEAIRKGMSESQAVEHVRRLLPGAEKQYFVEDMYHTYKNPELFISENGPQGPGEIMRNMMGMKSGELTDSPLSSMRPRIRAMRERAPEVYEELRQTAKDIAEYGFEP